MRIPFTKAFFICLIVFLSLEVTVANLGLKKSFIGDDSVVRYVYPDILIKNAWSTWNEYIFPGASSAAASTEFIFAHFILLFYSFGFTDVFISRLLYILFFLLSAVGMFYLFPEINSKEDETADTNYFAAFIASLIYSFNYFTAVEVSFPLTNYHISYCLFPWIFYFFIKIFRGDARFKSIFLYALLLLIFFSGNPANTLSSLVFIAVWAWWFRDERCIKFRSFILLGALMLLLSSYILLPLLSLSSSPYPNVTLGGNQDSLNFNSLRTSFINLFRFQGFHSAETFAFNKILMSNPVFIVASMVMILIPVFSIIKRKPKKLDVFLFGSFLFFIFLAKGIYPPFSSLFSFMFNKVFILQMYRATYVKFMPFVIFSIALLCGKFILQYKQGFFDRFGRYFLVLLLCGVFINTFPLVTGKAARSFHLSEIPAEYNTARTYLSAVPADFSILSLPQLKGSSLKWTGDNYYAGQFFQDSFLLGRPVWAVSWFDKSLNRYFSNSADLLDGLKLLGGYGVKFILLHKDIPEDYDFGGQLKYTVGGYYQSSKMEKVLKSSKELTLVIENQYFNLYKISDENFVSPIYIGREVSPDLEVVGSPTLVYRKINATEYKVTVNGVKGALPLVFAFSFHPDWELYQIAYSPNAQIEAKTGNFVTRNLFSYLPRYDRSVNLWRGFNGINSGNNNYPNLNIVNTLSLFNKTSNRVLLGNHTKTNNFANAWVIDTRNICENSKLCTINSDGTYNISLLIFYKPQRYFILGLMLLGLTFILGTVYILITGYKRRTTK